MANLKKNFFYNLVLTISNILFPIITFPYASRILGPEGIGKVQFVTNFAMYFILMAALGIPLYGIREVAKHRNCESQLRSLFTELVLLNFMTSMGLFVVYCLIVYLSPALYRYESYYAVASVMLLLSACNVDWLFSGLERFRFIAVRSVIIKLLGFAAIFCFVKERSDDIHYLAITVCSMVLSNLWNVWSARKYFSLKDFGISNCVRHIRPLFYIFSTVAAVSIYTMMDTIILGLLTDFTSVGYYTAASRITKITIPVLTSLGMVLIPQMSQAFKEKNHEVVNHLARNSFDFVLLLGIPMTVGLIALAPELILLFSGKEFHNAVLPLQLFSPVILIIGLSNVWALQILTPSGNEKYVTVSSVIGLVISLILNFTLIPYFSYTGAVVANLISEIVVMSALVFYTSKIINVRLDYELGIKTLLFSLLFFPIVLLVRYLFPYSPTLISIVSIVCCGILFLYFQIFHVKNESIMKMVNKALKR